MKNRLSQYFRELRSQQKAVAAKKEPKPEVKMEDNLFGEEKNLKKYIRLMLGEPVVNIYLTDDQLELCINHAKETIESFKLLADDPMEAEIQDQLVKEGALALAQIIVGRIYIQQKNTEEGTFLYEAGSEMRDTWESKLLWVLDLDELDDEDEK